MAYQGLKKSGNGANKLGVNYMGRASGSTPHGGAVIVLDEVASGATEPDVDQAVHPLGENVLIAYNDAVSKGVISALMLKARLAIMNYMVNHPAPTLVILGVDWAGDKLSLSHLGDAADTVGILPGVELSGVSTTDARAVQPNAVFAGAGTSTLQHDLVVIYDPTTPLWMLMQQFDRLYCRFINLTAAVT